MGYWGAAPPAPSPGFGTTRTLSQGVWERWCWHPGPRAWARLSSAPLQSRGSAQRSKELFAVRHVPNISENIKKEAIKAPSSWLPACWLTAALSAAGGELCSAAKPCWGHGALCHPP